MTTTDFTTTILVDQTPEAAFEAINNVRGWWSEDIEGPTDQVNGIFDYHFRDLHRCKIKVVELVPGKKVTWLVLDNYFNFTEDKNEWKGTTINFDISQKEDKTAIQLTHIGLVPEYECYDICKDAWTAFIRKSLYDLITTGQGQPNPKEKKGRINEEVMEKHKLQSDLN